MKPETILLTGGAGFVGANLARMLLSAGRRVRVLDDFSAGQRRYLEGLDLEVLEGDILDRAVVSQALENVGAVVHLAAQTGVPGSIADPFKDCRLNVEGTLNLLEACRKHNVERFVFSSSNAPMGRQPPPATEDKAPLPIAPYGASKLAGEAYCLAYHGSWGMNAVVLRFANLYGPFSGHKGSVVAKFLRDLAEKGSITIDGSGEQTRDFIYVGDLCAAVLLALDSGLGGEVFQIATGVETSISGLAEMVQALVGTDLEIVHGPSRQGDIDRNYSEVSKARRVLGWEPKVGLAEGLKATYRWFQQELQAQAG